MAQATVKQVQALEQAHKEQFALLAQANNLLINLQDRLPTMSIVERLTVQQYYTDLVGLVSKWLTRQMTLEKAGIPQQHPVFFSKATQADVNRMVAANDAQQQTLGFIPLIIWGVIALIAFFSADYIVSQTTSTEKEKEQLLNSTANVCKNLNLSPEACQELLTSGLKPPPGDSFLTSITKPLVYGGIGYFLITHWDKIENAFTKSKSKSR